MPKPIPISTAKAIAKSFEYDQVIIYARNVGGAEHMTTFGKDKKHCADCAKIGDHLKHKVFNWPKAE